MIEQAMIFALGFLIAGVLALAVAPAIWRRALRLTVRRLEMQLPLSPDEIRAERDQLRAEAAVAQRRIEQKMSALNEARSGDMEELGRRAAALAAVEEARAALAAEFATTRAALDDTTATAFTAEKALYDTLGAYAKAQDALTSLRQDHEALQLVADGRRASAAALEARSASLQLRLDDMHDALGKTEALLAAKTHEAARLSQDLSGARSEIAQATAARETLEKRFAAETARREVTQAAHAATRQEFDGLAAELRAAKGRHDLDGRSLADLRAALEAANQRHEAATARNRDGERIAAETRDALRAENAGLNGALEAAWQELARLREEAAATAAVLAAPAGSSDAQLRHSIQEIGAAVVRLIGTPPQPPSPVSDVPRALAGLRIDDLRPQQKPAVGPAEHERT